MDNTFTGTVPNNYEFYYNKYDSNSRATDINNKSFCLLVNEVSNIEIQSDDLLFISSSNLQYKTLILRKFKYEGRTFVLDQSAFKFQIQIKDEFIFTDNDSLNIYSYGDSFKEFLSSLIRDIVFLYDHFACSDDNKLAKDAIRLKQTLRRNMRVVSDVISK